MSSEKGAGLEKEYGPFDLTEKTVVAVTAIHHTKTYSFWIIGLAAFFLLINLSRTDVQNAIVYTLYSVAITILYYLTLLVYVVIKTKRDYKLVKARFSSIRWKIGEDGINVTSEQSSANFAWREYKHCRLKRRLILIKHTTSFQHIMPAAVCRDIEEAKELTKWINERIRLSRL
jgi:hypothetical protein